MQTKMKEKDVGLCPLEMLDPLWRFYLFDRGGYCESAHPGTDPASFSGRGNGIPLCYEMLMRWSGDQRRSSRWNSWTIVPAVTREDW